MNQSYLSYFSRYKHEVLYLMLDLGSYENEVVGNCIEISLDYYMDSNNSGKNNLADILDTKWMNYFVEFLGIVPRINREKFICEAIKLSSYVNPESEPEFYKASLFFNQCVIHNFISEGVLPFSEKDCDIFYKSKEEDIKERYKTLCKNAFEINRQSNQIQQLHLIVSLILNYLKNPNIPANSIERKFIDLNATRELMAPLLLNITDPQRDLKEYGDVSDEVNAKFLTFIIPLILKYDSFEETQKILGEILVTSSLDTRSVLLSSLKYEKLNKKDAKETLVSPIKILQLSVDSLIFDEQYLTSVIKFSNVLNNPFTDNFYQNDTKELIFNLTSVLNSPESFKYLRDSFDDTVINSSISSKTLNKDEKLQFLGNKIDEGFFSDLQSYCDLKEHLKVGTGNRVSLLSTKEMLFFLKNSYKYDLMLDSPRNREILKDFFENINDKRKDEISDFLTEFRYSRRVLWIADIIIDLADESPDSFSSVADGLYECFKKNINFNISLNNEKEDSQIYLNNHIEILEDSLDKFPLKVDDRHLASIISFIYGVCPFDNILGQNLLKKVASLNYQLFISVTSQLELHQKTWMKNPGMNFYPIILGDFVWSLNGIFQKNRGYPNEVLQAIIIEGKISEKLFPNSTDKVIESNIDMFTESFKI